MIILFLFGLFLVLIVLAILISVGFRLTDIYDKYCERNKYDAFSTTEKSS